MLVMLYLKLTRYVDAFTEKKHWRLFVVLFCALYCIVFNFPTYKTLLDAKPRNILVWNKINQQIDHPFQGNYEGDLQQHEAKMTFRLTGPLIGKLIPTENKINRIRGLFFIINIAGLLFFYLLLRFGETYFDNKLLSILLPLSFAVLYVGKTFFYDMYLFFDCLAFLFLLLSVSTRNPYLVFISLILAFYTDERALVGSGFVMLFHLLQYKYHLNNKRAILSIPLAIVFYFITRSLLHYFFGMTVTTDGLGITSVAGYTRFSYFMLGIFIAFKSFWVLFLLGLFYLKGLKLFSIFIVSLFTILLVGLSADFSRSISYGFIGILALLYYFSKEKMGKHELNGLMLAMLVTSMLNPVFDVHSEELFLSRSIFARFFDSMFYQGMN